MEFIAGHTYKVTGFTKNIDHKTRAQFTTCGLSPGAHFRVNRLDSEGFEIETMRVKTTLPKEMLQSLLIETDK